ncbi:MAG: abortive infection protein [Nitrososphaerota archaeon]|nr:abortive infection protein [Nitrososphaerota archaeon]
MKLKGVCYDSGVHMGFNWRPDFEVAIVRRELEIIKRDLHCNAVKVTGSDVGRMAICARAALEQGLEVWFSPAALDKTQDATLTLVVNAAREAEKLNQEYPDKVVFVVGGEFTLFVSGIVEGKNFMKRMANVAKDFGQQRQAGREAEDPAESVLRLTTADHNKLLRNFLKNLTDSVRLVFHGKITYASLVWESVDWGPFDFVGVDHYRAAKVKDRYVDMLGPAFESGKPVVITEFGMPTYEGAEVNGAGLGGDIIEERSRIFHYMLPLLGRLVRPKLKSGKHVRDEGLQARELVDQLTVLDNAGVYGAFVATFIEQTKPYDDDPRYDIDMGSVSLVKYYEGGRRRGTTFPDMPWEPKESFRAVADYYASH